MFETILVGVDGREGGRDALALAGRLAELDGGRVIVLHASPYAEFAAGNSVAGYDEALRAEARKALKREVAESGVEVADMIAVTDQSPGRALHEWAARVRADVVVVGSARHGKVGAVHFGDDVAGVLHGTACPVVVAPRGIAARGIELRRIGVGFDGRDESREALRCAAAIARLARGTLRVIAVVPPEPAVAPASGYGFEWGVVARRSRDAMEEEVRHTVQQLDIPASAETVVGLPAERLAEASRDLDLLVVGSRNYGPVRRVLPGSTSLRLTRRASCPVVVVPRGAGRPSAEAEEQSAMAGEGFEPSKA